MWSLGLGKHKVCLDWFPGFSAYCLEDWLSYTSWITEMLHTVCIVFWWYFSSLGENSYISCLYIIQFSCMIFLYIIDMSACLLISNASGNHCLCAMSHLPHPAIYKSISYNERNSGVIERSLKKCYYSIFFQPWQLWRSMKI